jgi:hypothetical protein
VLVKQFSQGGQAPLKRVILGVFRQGKNLPVLVCSGWIEPLAWINLRTLQHTIPTIAANIPNAKGPHSLKNRQGSRTITVATGYVGSFPASQITQA